MATFLMGAVVSLHVALSKSDEMYAKFQSHSPSLIAGSSRALIGIDPAILEQELGIPMLNFAFTLANSPYGSRYVNALLDKLDADSAGVVVLEVSPLAFSTKSANRSDDPTNYRENTGFLTTWPINLGPNPDYMISHAKRPLYLNIMNAMSREYPKGVSQGWRPLMASPDRLDASERSAKEYRVKVFPNYFLSQKRYAEFLRLLAALPATKQVVLVRMPTSAAMEEMEGSFCPEFDQLMEGAVQDRAHAIYLNYADLSGQFEAADAHHLTTSGSAAFTHLLATQIRKNQAEEAR